MSTSMYVSRREFLGRAGAVGALALVGPGRLFGQDAPATSMREVRRGVGYFTGRGGTIGWLVNDEALVTVDTQMPGTAELCIQALEERSARMIDLLVNSHHHFDHTGGNAIFRPKAKKILAHEHVPSLQKAAAERSNRLEGQVYADATFADTWREEYGDETVSLRYWGPAHTGGDSIIHFEEANVVHMGDLVFNRMAPYIDTQGGSKVKNWITVLEKTVRQFDDDTVFIFGHGNEKYGITGTRDDVAAMKSYLTALYSYVEKGHKEGKSADELASIDALDGFDVYAAGTTKSRFQSGIREVYSQLSADSGR